MEPLGVRTMLKTGNNVVGETHDDHLTVSLPIPPVPGPQIKDVVQVDVGEQGGCAGPLRGSLLACRPRAVLDHSRVQPFLDEPQDPFIRDPMLDEPAEPPVELLSRPVDQDLLGCVFLSLLAGSLDEFAVGEGRSGADQGDEVRGVDGPPAVLR